MCCKPEVSSFLIQSNSRITMPYITIFRVKRFQVFGWFYMLCVVLLFVYNDIDYNDNPDIAMLF
jgi:hypothetical protein